MISLSLFKPDTAGLAAFGSTEMIDSFYCSELAYLNAGPTVSAEIIVDNRMVINDLYSLGRAVLFAEHTAHAAVRADFFGILCRVL